MVLNTRFLYMLVSVGVLFFLLGASQASNTDVVSLLANLSWDVNEKSKAELEKISPEEINKFINELLKEADTRIGRESGELGQHLFRDLNKDNTYELLATLDYSGRAFYSVLIVVKKVNKRFEYQELRAFNITNLKKIIVDLDQDGIQELRVEGLFTSYKGVRPTAYWTDIYQWDGKQYVRASENFPRFYEAEIRELQEKIKVLGENIKKRQQELKGKGAGVRSDDLLYHLHLQKRAYTIEVEKVQRLLTPQSKAGFDTAADLFRSNTGDKLTDLEAKGDAITIWEDIGDEESLTRLHEATQDPRVGKEAERALDQIIRKHKEQKK